MYIIDMSTAILRTPMPQTTGTGKALPQSRLTGVAKSYPGPNMDVDEQLISLAKTCVRKVSAAPLSSWILILYTEIVN